ncbi:ABC transporter permease [Rugosimonospora acidiphila]|uniref:ABC transporter permease n=1 Tax=Rugosimonospora acidiphila TaxID=556531 RepID=A0ABP9RTI6_9ACTN
MLMKTQARPKTGPLYTVGLPILGPVVFIAAWWLATIVFHIQQFVLPAPPQIVTAFGDQASLLFSSSWVTLRETLIGFLIAAVGGLVVALLLTTFDGIQRAAWPVVVTINAVPKLAVAPLLVLWMGFGGTPKIVMAALISFFPIVLSTANGLGSVPADLRELARALNAPWWKTFSKIRLPGALPQVFVGLKVAAPLAIVGAVVSELSNSSEGLGFVLINESAQGETAIAFAAVVLLTVESMLVYYALAGLERLVVPWARDTAKA